MEIGDSHGVERWLMDRYGLFMMIYTPVIALN